MGVNFDPMTCRDLFVKADSLKLKQALLNLVTNAVKNIYENGNVDILGSMGQNGLIRICVSDTGIGISPDRITDLIQSFNRLRAENRQSKVPVLIW